MGLLSLRRSELWIVRPCEPPRLRRYCPGCGAAREFVCARRFRTNAQKKTLDVWLKYRCSICDCTWKAPIFERIATTQLDDSLREAFERDDASAVARYAFDVDRWRRDVIEVIHDDRVITERRPISCECEPEAHACVHFETPFVCAVRVDRLLAAELGVSRALLQRMFEEGAISLSPASKEGVRRRVRTGVCARLNAASASVEV